MHFDLSRTTARILALVLPLASCTTFANAEEYLYFSRFSLQRTPVVTPGTPLDTVMPSQPPGAYIVAGSLYYGDEAGLRRAFPDGTGEVTIAPATPTHLAVTALALDEASGKIYFGRLPINNDDDPYLLAMADAGNGTGYSAIDALGGVDYLAIDSDSGKVFWSYSTSASSFRVIKSANLNLTGVATVSTNFPNNITGLAVDAVNNHIYYSTATLIGRMNYDGSSQQTILNTSASKLQLRPNTNKLYWLDGLTAIKRCDLNGSNVETVMTAASVGETIFNSMAIGDVFAMPGPTTPAVSTWGAIVLMLTLLVVATNMLRLRQLAPQTANT